MPTWGKYEQLRPRQIDAILAKTPIAYIPWGSLEWHSYQNPIGLDALKVHRLALMAAERTGGVVLPAVFAGYDTMKPWGGFKHTLETPVEAVVSLANAYLDQLADEGFKVVVILMGHYGGEHVQALRQAAANWQRIRGHGRDMRIWALPEYELRQENVSPVADHAGQYETALMMYLCPELVDLDELPADGDVVGTESGSFGISGDDPRQATAQIGQRLAEEIVAGLESGVAERL